MSAEPAWHEEKEGKWSNTLHKSDLQFSCLLRNSQWKTRPEPTHPPTQHFVTIVEKELLYMRDECHRDGSLFEMLKLLLSSRSDRAASCFRSCCQCSAHLLSVDCLVEGFGSSAKLKAGLWVTSNQIRYPSIRKGTAQMTRSGG